jgi:DNA-binding transcriptional ArsR family regulator
MNDVSLAHDTYRAISAPSRRLILDLLQEDERSVGDLVDHVAMSQPAVSQHLRILQEAGLVRSRKSGRTRIYQLNAEPLRELYDWRRFAQGVLDVWKEAASVHSIAEIAAA